MSQKNIEFKSHKAQSHDEKKIRSSQHSKIKKSMADQLREEIDTLIKKQKKAKVETWESYQEYKNWKAQGNDTEADFHYQSYQTWSDEAHRLIEEIQVKLKAVQIYQSPSKKIEKPKIIDKKDYLKYGPSREE